MLLNPFRFASVVAVQNPEVVAHNSYKDGSTKNLTMAIPTGTADGDLIVAFLFNNNNASLISGPAGWTNAVNDSVTANSVRVDYRTASSEPASYSWTCSSTSQISGIIISFRDLSYGALSLDAGTLSRSAPSYPSIAAPSFASTLAGGVVFLSCNSTNTSTASATGMTQIDFVSFGKVSQSVFYESSTAAGATGDRTATWSIGSPSTLVGLLIKLGK